MSEENNFFEDKTQDAHESGSDTPNTEGGNIPPAEDGSAAAPQENSADRPVGDSSQVSFETDVIGHENMVQESTVEIPSVGSFDSHMAGQNKPTGKKGFKIFCVALAFVVFVSLAGGFGYMAGQNGASPSQTPDSSSGLFASDTIEFNDGDQGEAAKSSSEAIASAMKSVVTITVYSKSSSVTSRLQASGVILDKNGYIITNDSIYADIPSAAFLVKTSDGKEYTAEYVAGDSRSDLAVLKISNPQNLIPATLGDSDKISLGQAVIAIGNPSGVNSISKGVISAPSVRVSGQSGKGGPSYNVKCIQTDIFVNGALNGGVMIDAKGQVIGINSASFTSQDYIGMGYSVPINEVKQIAASLTKNGYVTTRARLGITYSMVDSVVAKQNNVKQGAMIAEIEAGSSLAAAGIAKGDIITAVGGKAVNDKEVLLSEIDAKKPGEKLTLKIYVAATKKEKTVEATLLDDRGTSSYNSNTQQNNGTTLAPLF